MKNIFLCLLTVIVITNLAFSQSNEYYFKFAEKDKNIVNTTITKIISVDNYKDGVVWAYANDNEFKEFKKLGYDYELLPAPSSLTKVITMANTVAEMANWDRYPTYGVYRQMLKNYQTNYPSLCKLDSICNLASGRKIYTVKISDNVATPENEPEYMFCSTMHGDETVGFILMLRLIDYLLVNYASLPRVQNIVNNIELYILPNINPDGTYYGGNHTVANARRGNINGVDINRDFPDPRIGANNPPYEPETQAMIDFAAAHHIIMGGSIHGGSEVMNYPWDIWTGGPPDNHKHADDIWCRQVRTNYVTTARILNSSYLTSVTPSGITNGGDWYVITGGIQDYYTYWNHSRIVTMELSNTKLLGCEYLQTFWNYNRDALLGFIEECLYGFRGTVKNVSTNPLNASITIVPHDIDNSWVVTDPVIGDYHRLIAPGTYDVTYSSTGYISQTHSVNVASFTSTTIKDVVLLQAQQTNVSGTITDAGSGLPIQGVTVQLLNSPYPAVQTNSSGQYIINNVYEGTYTLQASKTGYITMNQSVNITVVNNIFNFSMSLADPEGFEAGLPYCWVNSSGNLAWTQVNTAPHSGSYCMKSGGFNVSNANSSLQLSLNIAGAGNISFWNKVSSESGYDFLKFYIDGVEKGSWSGTLAWTEQSYPVTTGSHIFKWSYIKDGSLNVGSDCGWIDDIIFPLSFQSVVFTVKDQYNNPVQDANVNFNGTNQLTNSGGTATFTNVSRGTNKPYIITKSGFITNTGSISVNYCDASQNIMLITMSINEKPDVIPVTIYPNPFSNFISVSSAIPVDEIIIFDIVGSELVRMNCNSIKLLISTENLSKGIYFIQLKTENGYVYKKIIKE